MYNPTQNTHCSSHGPLHHQVISSYDIDLKHLPYSCHLKKLQLLNIEKLYKMHETLFIQVSLKEIIM